MLFMWFLRGILCDCAHFLTGSHTHQEGSEAHATQTPQPNVKQTHSISLFKKMFSTFKALRRKRSGALQNTGNKQLVYTFS